MINNTARIGNFTSSEIVALTTRDKSGKGFGKPALTYIEETNFERNLGRSLSDECNARPLTWGKLLEPRPFELLSTAYSLNSSDTIVHPLYDYWAGSPDGFKYDEGKTVTDIKCPFTAKSFCQLVKAIYAFNLSGIDAINYIRQYHKDGEKYYWQLISNACITGSKYAELIVYMPYLSELADIKDMADDGQGKHYFISMAMDGELPYLVDGGYYKNINIIRFEVPQIAKDFLIESVVRAGELLIKPPSILIASSIPEGVMIENGKP